MQIVCPACSKRLQIADDKLPTDRQVRLTCPACQQRFAFDPQTQGASTDAAAALQAAAQTPALVTQRIQRSPRTTAVNLDITNVGSAPRALVCLDASQEREAYQDILSSLGYHTVHTPSQQAEALAYLTQVPYECLIIDASFDGGTLEANPVLACFHELPMDRRRYTFVALCLPDVVTADAMTAYSHSVGLVINRNDVLDSRRPLEQQLSEHKRLYKVYRELRQQLGKDF